MADQVEVPKLNDTIALGPLASAVAVPKLVMSVLLIPGADDGTDTSNKQGHVHAQIIKRA